MWGDMGRYGALSWRRSSSDARAEATARSCSALARPKADSVMPARYKGERAISTRLQAAAASSAASLAAAAASTALATALAAAEPWLGFGFGLGLGLGLG